MQIEVTKATLKPVAEKVVARLNQMGFVSPTGHPMVVDQGFELVAALLGYRNQHALRVKLEGEGVASLTTAVAVETPLGSNERLRREVSENLEKVFGEQHPILDRRMYQLELDCGDTRVPSYWEWVSYRLEEEGSFEWVLHFHSAVSDLPITSEVQALQFVETLLEIMVKSGFEEGTPQYEAVSAALKAAAREETYENRTEGKSGDRMFWIDMELAADEALSEFDFHPIMEAAPDWDVAQTNLTGWRLTKKHPGTPDEAHRIVRLELRIPGQPIKEKIVNFYVDIVDGVFRNVRIEGPSDGI